MSAVAGLALSVLIGGALSSRASADPAPIAQHTAAGVTADALPTAQMNGVGWTQVVAGNTVYVGGNFTTARPAGIALNGAGSVTRNNALAYDITTGALNSWAPSFNGEIRAMALSTDGSTLYVGGVFTSVTIGATASTRYRVAAFNAATGALLPWAPTLNAKVSAIAVTATGIYVGGAFSNASGQARSYVAGFNPANGALLPWAPTTNGDVNAMVASPDGTRVIIGGVFSQIDGATALGLGAVDAAGTLQPWAMNQIVQDYGSQAAILSLSTDGQYVYGTGYVYGSPGNFEGTFAADPVTGAVHWLEDCHGDSYGAFGVNGVVYVVSHEHYCTTVGGFPDTNPRNRWARTSAFTQAATGTLLHNTEGGYYDFYNQPSPTMINWFPNLTAGTFTGQNQAAWTVSGNSSYVVEAGEFPSVNGKAQQGLVRFAIPSIAPNKMGPSDTTSAINPTITPLSTTTARVSFQTNTDMDDENLTYTVIRSDKGTAAPVYTTTATSQFWNRPTIGFIDSGLTPGKSVYYYYNVSDPSGNKVRSANITITMPTSFSAYESDVLTDGASDYWRLDDATGTTGADTAGFNNLVETSGVTGGATGALLNDADKAASFDGSSGTAGTSSSLTGPNTFTAEAWINTTTTQGGKIMGFGDQQTGASSSYDRHIYMDNAGHLIFGVYPGSVQTVISPSTYNNGQWHYVLAELSPAGQALYVDGLRVGINTGVTTAQGYTGYWRVGGDNLSGWTNQPSSNYFNGTIDEAAVYPTALNATQIRQHYTDAGYTTNIPAVPTDNYGKAVYASNPDIYWRLDDQGGSTALDTSPNQSNGIYSGGVQYQQPSTVTGANGTGVTFNGSNGTIGSAAQYNNPTVYSEEAWFKTTTTSGGKIIGFGDQQSGTSSNYDRHVYMLNSGQLVFGAWTGQANLAQSTQPYNDGQWHYMVATQGPDGMKLYVDGQVVGTNPDTAAQPYAGYWRVGGDSDWGGDSFFFNGEIDEVAVYLSELTPSQITAHYKASPDAVNVPPTASFSHTENGLSTSLDASASTDSDGTVASYSWAFGDGATETDTTPTTTHTYSGTGNYTVTLTVTDNLGAASTVTSQSVSVTAPSNQSPTASFTATSNGLTGSFDASNSNDPDGTVASYTWTFDDGTSETDTTATTTHLYNGGGTYNVSLTVTDNKGANSTATTHQLVVTAPNQSPTASFTTAVSNLQVTLDAGASADPDGTVASYSWSFGDGTSETDATATTSHKYGADGTYTISLTVTDNKGAASTAVTKSVLVAANKPPVAAFTSPCTALSCTFDGATSSDPDGTVATYAWDFGDGTTLAANASASAPHTYQNGGTYNVSLTVTDNQGAQGTKTASITVASASNKPPVAAFTATPVNLTESLDASASSDPDGTVASYSWDFGDGSTAAASGSTTASHTYASAGTYTVTLTVTDNQGAATTLARPVTLNPVTVFAADAFTRTVVAKWGTADLGGAWTTSGSASLFSVNGSAAAIALTPGSGPSAFLNSVAAANVDATIDIAINAPATGSGFYMVLAERHTATGDYRLRFRAQPGTSTLTLTKVVSGTETSLKAVTVPVVYTSGEVIRLRMSVSGNGTTSTLNGKVWPVGTAQPAAWQVSTTDTTASLQGTGGVGVSTYLPSNATTPTASMTFDNLLVGNS